MNALSLSESTPSIANGRSAAALSNPSITSIWLRTRMATHSVQPLAISVSVRGDELTVYLRAAAVFDHVDLEEARRWVAPVGEGTHRNASPDGRAHPRAPLALPINVRTRVGQHAIDGRRADLKEFGLDDRMSTSSVIFPKWGVSIRR